MTETTALGAAYLAGLGVGVWSTAAELAVDLRMPRRQVDAVRPTARHTDAAYAQWRRAVERSRGWATD